MYGKVFQSMYTGSMYGAGATVWAVWTWILVHKDQDGFVEINPKFLAPMIGVEEEKVVFALDYLKQEDSKSRSPDEEGRRIILVGAYTYHVVNHQKYMDLKSLSDRREQNKQAKRRERSKKTDSQHTVSTCQQPSAVSAHIDKDIDKDKEKVTTPPTKIPKTKHGDFVFLSDGEFRKLVEKFTLTGTLARIERLDTYIGSKGKKYKSHYHTILAWAQKDTPEPDATAGTNGRTRELTEEEADKLLEPESHD